MPWISPAISTLFGPAGGGEPVNLRRPNTLSITDFLTAV
jgi:hypothetical protein